MDIKGYFSSKRPNSFYFSGLKAKYLVLILHFLANGTDWWETRVVGG